ncbi:MAG TPA: hypothetical protein VE955_07270 [Candidatus Dormibacteraeota bacterium]|jgi:hypothetical protein|nr:hypothetical protein [Candidatus Dormibacteraeota bacterium]
MVEIDVKIPKHRLTYLPKILVEQLGPNVTIRPDTKSAILYRTGEDLAVVVESLEILRQDLQLQARHSPNKSKATGGTPSPAPLSPSGQGRGEEAV